VSRGRVRAYAALVAVATAAAWTVLGGLPWPARAMTTFLLVPLPGLLLLQARMVQAIPDDAEREQVYVSSALSVWLLAALAMLAARFGGLSRVELGLAPLDTATTLGAAGLATLAGLAIMGAGRLVDVPEAALVDYLIPRSASEKIAFAGLSVSAGIAEELVFRGFLIAALLAATGSVPIAVGVSVAAFALSHAYQGPVGVVRVVFLGVVLAAPLVLTGSVYPSILAHTALDLLAGLVLADWLGAGPGEH
jgi:membrane protease YdiL (CAAX protease family)